MSPVRVQRRRTKGWRMPENTVYVGRGSGWGNQCVVAPQGRRGPFDVVIKNLYGQIIGFVESARDMASARAIAKDTYARWLGSQSELWLLGYVMKLRGKNLACWCPLDQPCHADVLLELANQ